MFGASVTRSPRSRRRSAATSIRGSSDGEEAARTATWEVVVRGRGLRSMRSEYERRTQNAELRNLEKRRARSATLILNSQFFILRSAFVLRRQEKRGADL